MNENNKVRPFGMRDKIGYMFGDFGNDFTFIFASSFLMVFYTKVLGISGAMVGTLFLLARVVDAFTDITMGRIVDSVKPARDGRFRCWVRKMCGPVAIASFLMYQSAMAGAPMALKVVYMYVTYLLWGSVFYTSINIPYGSMASAITDKPDERTALSTFRTVGGTLAGLIIGTVTPLLIYTKDADGNQIVRGGSTFTIIAGVFALCAVLCYVICYKLTTERVKVEPDPDAKKVTLGQTFAAIFRSRALLGIIGAAIFLLLSQLLIQAMNNYLYTEYFGSAGAISIMTILNTVLMLVVVAPLSVPISRRFGKKEASTVGALLAGTVFLLLFFLKVKNVAVYIVLANIGMLGLGFFNTVIWANITDVIDDQEVKTGQREDGTVYAVYSFTRKLGQALAGGAGGWALSIIGYDQLAKVQTEAVINGLYTTSTLIPAVCFFIVALFLWFIYPLGKKNVEANVEELKRRRENA